MILTPERRAEVTKPGCCYVIQCWTPYCLCDREGYGCEAGFFSLFLRALYGIRLAAKYDVPYYVDFGSISYGYNDPERFDGDTNFWNYYFRQPIPTPPPPEAAVDNTLYETLPLRIWSRSFFQEMNDVIQNHIRLQPDVEALIDEKKEHFRHQKVLGVHIRRTDHSTEVEPIPLDAFKAVIRSVIQNFDTIFVATDDQYTLESMIDEFGARVIYNDATRSITGAPVHRHHPPKNRYALGLEALLDAYCLSLCHESILLHSNLSFAALLLNPTLEYTLLETPKHRNMRFKTLIAYYLDQWGVRRSKR